jgi:hypothetical protein
MGDDFSHIELFKRLHMFQDRERRGQYVSERSHKTLVMFYKFLFHKILFDCFHLIMDKILTSKSILGGRDGLLRRALLKLLPVGLLVLPFLRYLTRGLYSSKRLHVWLGLWSRTCQVIAPVGFLSIYRVICADWYWWSNSWDQGSGEGASD